MPFYLINIMSEQYTDFRVILDKITRHPLLQDLTMETVVDYTIDFMRIVGSPTIFQDKIELIEIKSYRGLLPTDFYQVIQIRSDDKNSVAYRYTTDNFHLSDNKDPSIDPTYKIQDNIIFTSTEKIPIELSYRAIAVDACGYPLLPDNSSFFRALEAYIKVQWFTILFDLGKLSPQILTQAKQDYAWAVGDCESEFKRLTIDKMESLCNSWRTLLMRPSEHSNGFKHDGTKEFLKYH